MVFLSMKPETIMFLRAVYVIFVCAVDTQNVPIFMGFAKKIQLRSLLQKQKFLVLVIEEV